jgi:septal ring factor EnvC (AmiA/AmiB activator)
VSADDDLRVEQLLRENERLAAEVRSLTLGAADTPRPASMPSSRLLARLTDERDGYRAELEATQRELEALRRDRAGLERQAQELEREVVRLRTGWLGILRRARGRLLGSRVR